MHHIGLWSDSIPAEAERLVRTGRPDRHRPRRERRVIERPLQRALSRNP
jgi:hypothetical protein